MIKKSFYINRTDNSGGPAIFGSRLKNYLVANDYSWSALLPDYNLIFSYGIKRPKSYNILRMDGIYIDNNKKKNNGGVLNNKLSKIYHSTDLHIFQSRFSQNLYEEFFGYCDSKKQIIHNGVPKQFNPLGDSYNYGFEKVLITSARWVAHKRLDSIIEGFKYFKENSNIDLGLVILGDISNFEISITKDIICLGKVKPEDLPYYLRGANAFISLSWLDNCPNSVVEALACGLPVLTSHNGGTKELVGDNGIIMEFESDYQYDFVNLYNPPLCQPSKVAHGIDLILKKSNEFQINQFQMNTVRLKYKAFINSI